MQIEAGEVDAGQVSTRSDNMTLIDRPLLGWPGPLIATIC